MSWDGKLNAVVVGGGMISQEVILPTVCQERKRGKFDNISVSALTGSVTKVVRDLFPEENLTYYPDPTEADLDLDQAYPDLFEQAIEDLGDHGVVIVATPDHFHTPVMMQALEAGKDIICMKPLCLKVEEAYKIMNYADEVGGYIYVDYHKRHDRAVRALKHRYGKGELGEALHGHAWIEEPKYMALDVFKDWAAKSSPFEYIGTHYADVYYYVTGLMPKRVVGFGQKKFLPQHGSDAYDAVQAVIEWEDGSAFWIQTSWVCSNDTSAMTNQGLQFSGTKGEYWADHKFRNLHFLTDDQGFDQ